jgi:hypothetical protein
MSPKCSLSFWFKFEYPVLERCSGRYPLNLYRVVSFPPGHPILTATPLRSHDPGVSARGKPAEALLASLQKYRQPAVNLPGLPGCYVLYFTSCRKYSHVCYWGALHFYVFPLKILTLLVYITEVPNSNFDLEIWFSDSFLKIFLNPCRDCVFIFVKTSNFVP